MDKKQLGQLRHLKTEIELLKKQIGSIETRTTSDSVQASQVDFPYIEYTAKIEGVDMQEYSRKLRRLQRKLNRKIDELMDAAEETEEYINSIDDSLTRQILFLRYVNGLTWEQVAASIGGGNTADSVRKVSERFLEN